MIFTKKVFLLLVILLSASSNSSATMTITKCIHIDSESGSVDIYQIINGPGQCSQIFVPATAKRPAHTHSTAPSGPIYPQDQHPELAHCQYHANQGDYN